MTPKGQHIMQVIVDIVPDKENKWNEWYNNVHIPDILGCPGWYSARRYLRVAGDHGPKYTTLYEVEDEHVMESDLFKQRRGWGPFVADVNHVSNIFYKLISPETSKGQYILQVIVDIVPDKENKWNEWYNNVHIPDILGCPGWYSARRYLRVAGDHGPKYTTLYEVEDEHVMESDLFKQRAGWGPFAADVRHVSNIFYKLVFPDTV